MKAFFLLSLLLVVTTPLASQVLARKAGYQEIPFSRQLTLLTNTDSLKMIRLEIASIEKKMASAKGPEAPFSISDRWSLMYFQEYYRKDIGSHTTETEVFCTNRENKNETLTGAEIFTEFEINDTFSISKFPLKTTPVVYQRNDVFNGVWTPVYTTHDYLMMRCINSYPNGNVTSWYYKTVYYFKRAL